MNDFDQAQVHKDLAALTRLIADDYVLVNSDASVQRKPEVLADHRLPGFKIDPFVMKEPVIAVLDGAAVVSGLIDLSWTQDGKREKRLIRLANTWARRHGGWQVIYTQVTRVPQ
ncbi:MAG: nuclear transport factor 2 family protein [Vicinamibacteria bacterium]